MPHARAGGNGGVSIPLRKFRKRGRGSHPRRPTGVSIPLRKFRKDEVDHSRTSIISVSIPLRKFRKEPAQVAGLIRDIRFHPSKEV